jgi:hypothetical protein
MKEILIRYRIKLRHLIRNVKGNKDISLFFVIFLISAAFWLLSSLNKQHFSEIKFKVNYQNLPKNKVLIDELPEYLTLSVKARGYDIITNKLSFSLKTLNLDYKSFKTKVEKVNGVYEKQVETRKYLESIRKQLKNSELYDIFPAVISFRFADYMERKVPIKHNLALSFANQFILKEDIVLQPDSLIVSGDVSKVKKIEYVECISKEINEIEDDLEVDLELQNPKDVKCSYNAGVSAKIKVEKFTEANIEIPLSVINLPDSMAVNLFPNKCNLILNVGVSKYENLNSLSFKIAVNYNELKSSARIFVKEAPKYVKIKKITPEKVDFLIEKIK